MAATSTSPRPRLPSYLYGLGWRDGGRDLGLDAADDGRDPKRLWKVPSGRAAGGALDADACRTSAKTAAQKYTLLKERQKQTVKMRFRELLPPLLAVSRTSAYTRLSSLPRPGGPVAAGCGLRAGSDAGVGARATGDAFLIEASVNLGGSAVDGAREEKAGIVFVEGVAEPRGAVIPRSWLACSSVEARRPASSSAASRARERSARFSASRALGREGRFHRRKWPKSQ